MAGSAPSFDPNRFIGGIPYGYWRELQEDKRRPLYNKAIKGAYPPASVWKLATAVIAMEAGLVAINDRMEVPCTGATMKMSSIVAVRADTTYVMKPAPVHT